MRTSFAFVMVLCISLKASAFESQFKAWKNAKTPTPGEAQVIGAVDRGCLLGAKALPLEGPGFIVMQPQLKRNFGHPKMISYLTQVGATLAALGGPSMLIEDIAGARGGPAENGHMSHQTGLDVDISLVMQLPQIFPENERHKLISRSFVDHADKTKLSFMWKDSEQTALIQAAANHPDVNRIFVAPAIKKYFCEKFPDADWLYKLRALNGHDDHIHVRLNCPADSPDCLSQPALDPLEKQCGSKLLSSFDGWQTGIIHLGKAYRQPYPVLPKACVSVPYL